MKSNHKVGWVWDNFVLSPYLVAHPDLWDDLGPLWPVVRPVEDMEHYVKVHAKQVTQREECHLHTPALDSLRLDEAADEEVSRDQWTKYLQPTPGLAHV